jgi:hypothetical protein
MRRCLLGALRPGEGETIMKGCDVKFQGMLKGMLIEMQRVDYCQLIARSDIRG